jgi:hypothetical protein
MNLAKYEKSIFTIYLIYDYYILLTFQQKENYEEEIK